MQCLKLLLTQDMLLLSLAFLYSGLEISYWAGVLPSSVGFTVNIGVERKSLMGLASILVSLGSMLGGLMLISMKEMVNRRGRSMVIMFGLITHLTSFLLSWLHLPHSAPLGDTDHYSHLGKNHSTGLSTSASAKSSIFKHPDQLRVTLAPQC